MIRFSLVLVPTILILAVHGAQAEPARCIDDWSVAARIVAKESLTTIEAVRERVRAKHPGHIVKTVLCETRGVFTYRLTMKAPEGSFQSVIVDARSPGEK